MLCSGILDSLSRHHCINEHFPVWGDTGTGKSYFLSNTQDFCFIEKRNSVASSDGRFFPASLWLFSSSMNWRKFRIGMMETAIHIHRQIKQLTSAMCCTDFVMTSASYIWNYRRNYAERIWLMSLGIFDMKEAVLVESRKYYTVESDVLDRLFTDNAKLS